MEKGAFCCIVHREYKLQKIPGKGKSDFIKNKNVHTLYSEIPLLGTTATNILAHIHKDSCIRMVIPTHYF